MTEKQTIGRVTARRQSSAAAPEMDMVTVAVLPPRLPRELAPPTGVGAAGTFGWDESLNWQHNDPAEKEGEAPRRKSFLKKAGMTRQRTRANPDAPPFQFRTVTYEVWRKHYAKDADGNYRGTHAPAEDCLLKPNDVAKWNIGDAKTKADKWTRGTEALPVYEEAEAEGQAPHYDVYDDDNDYTRPPPEELVLGQQGSALYPTNTMSTTSTTLTSNTEPSSNRTIADGKTAAQIIAEAEAKPKRTKTQGWKNTFKRAAEFTMMGN